MSDFLSLLSMYLNIIWAYLLFEEVDTIVPGEIRLILLSKVRYWAELIELDLADYGLTTVSSISFFIELS